MAITVRSNTKKQTLTVTQPDGHKSVFTFVEAQALYYMIAHLLPDGWVVQSLAPLPDPKGFPRFAYETEQEWVQRWENARWVDKHHSQPFLNDVRKALKK